MQLVLCGVTDWDNLPEQDAVTYLDYCNSIWHDSKVIHICSDYANHANAGHACECGEVG